MALTQHASTMQVFSSLPIAEALAFGAGLVQAALAVVFWRGRRVRPDWGLSWLALAFTCSAAINLPGALLAGAIRQPPGLAFAMIVLLGLTTLAALVVGVRMFIGRRSRSPWRSFAVVVLAFLMLATVTRLLVGRELGGHLATAVVFLYLAGLTAGAMRRLTGAANGLVLFSVLLHPAMVLVALGAGVDKVLLSLWSAVPYAMVGLGLLVAGIGRYHVELRAELGRRERAEAELRQLNASLEHRIEERTLELREMVGGLESFNRMVSHDLRGPLGGLAGLTALAQRATDEGDNVRLRRMLSLMGQETQRLVGLVGDLLVLARVNHADLELSTVPLDTVLDEALQSLVVSLGETAVSHVVREPLPPVRADRTLMRQVFVNLLGNALKFSTDQAQALVSVRGDRSPHEVVVEVRDNGIGFPPDRAAELFAPFKRLHGQDYDGTGIGLTIVRRIVERHGGRVWAEGRPGQGASFYFSLPA